MIPGPEIVIACPHCGNLALHSTLTSGNTIGATYWTDGKMIAPMLPEEPEITRCCNCSTIYWVDEAQKIGEIPFGHKDAADAIIDPEWLDAPHVEELDPEGYWQAIAEGVYANHEQETRLRLLAWWRANDPFRSSEDKVFNLTEEARKNAEALVDLFDGEEKPPENHLFRAELFRQMGMCKEAIEELQKVQEPN